jgi:flagellar operon protein (TIGR03826 family)
MSSNVKQCRQCGRLFQSFGANVCPDCAEELDRCFRIVKNYLYDHPDANIFDTARETGVPEKMVLGFLREGRLSVSGAEGMLECESCGAPISGGRFCLDCQNRLESELGSACKPEQAKKEEARKTSPLGRMHVNYHD